jgi:two-component system KDP operon response regulator KdpE
MIRALVVDDEPPIVTALRASLEARGYDVLSAGTGKDGLRMLSSAEPDIVILDLGLPDMEGAEVLRRLRAFSEVPVVILTVREEQAEKVVALEAGADDYVTKPFAMEELMARLRAVLRRAGPEVRTDPVVRFRDIEVDLSRQLVRKKDRIVHLTPTEYRLLEAMITNPGKLLTHRWLLARVWGPGYEAESQYLRVYVAQLRKKLEDEPATPRWILTDPGIGYRWSPD